MLKRGSIRKKQKGTENNPEISKYASNKILNYAFILITDKMILLC